MISIITICFNEGRLIDKTIDSVYKQSFTDYEYIIKDGGSTDDTLEKARKWEPLFKEKNIKYTILSGPDRGIYDAMNLGVQASEGEFINFMNSGDCFAGDDVLERIFKNGTEPGTDLIYGDTVEEEYGELHYFRKCPELIEERMPFSHQSVFVRRELLLKYPLRLEYEIAADYDFLLTLHDKGCNFKDSGVVVAKVTKDGKSSLKLKDTYMESLILRKEHGIKVPEGAGLKRKILWLDIKQFGMDHFPDSLKYLIRKVQRKIRGQKRFEDNKTS